MAEKGKNKNTLSWLLEEPFAYTIPSIGILNKTLSFFTRTFYILSRVFFRVKLGKEKRDNLKLFNKIQFYANIGCHFIFFYIS